MLLLGPRALPIGRTLGTLAVCVGLFAAEPVLAMGCEVIDFSAVKQRTQSFHRRTDGIDAGGSARRGAR